MFKKVIWKSFVNIICVHENFLWVRKGTEWKVSHSPPNSQNAIPPRSNHYYSFFFICFWKCFRQLQVIVYMSFYSNGSISYITLVTCFILLIIYLGVIFYHLWKYFFILSWSCILFHGLDVPWFIKSVPFWRTFCCFSSYAFRGSATVNYLMHRSLHTWALYL